MKIADIKESIPVSEVASKYVALQANGDEFIGLCPFHNEQTPSFTVNDEKGFFHCFGCGAHGDVIDFMTQAEGISFKQAVNQLSVVPSKPIPASKKKTYTPTLPVPDDQELLINAWWTGKFGSVEGRYGYFDNKGKLLGYIVRFQRAKAIPFRWCGRDGWQSMGFDKPRPLYNLFKVINSINSILVVEGEKKADIASLLFPSMTVVSWPGGANAVKHVDWTPLTGRDIIVWRDNDAPGKKAEEEICGLLKDCTIRIFKDNALDDYPEGWDVGDLMLTGQQATDWLGGNLTEYQRGGAGGDPSQDTDKSAQPLNQYFKCLGQVGNKYYFYNYSSGQVSHVSHDGLNEMFLMTLSNGKRSYWNQGDGKKPDWKYHAGLLIETCHSAGQFDLGMIRGRGTWEDNGRIVTNNGDGLVYKGKKLAMNHFDSDYVYIRSKKLNQEITQPVTRNDLARLLDVIERLRWDDKVCAKLFAGWLMAAPICGAMPWRSHLYVSGPAGSGKTWLYENIINRVLGKVSMRVSSKTTEAGIRHALGPDALPVIFDEAEAENIRDAERMQGIMDLARQASSADGAPILKGTANQEGAKIFFIRSSFCFLSIMPSIRQYADETRITILTLKNKEDVTPEAAKEKFKLLSKDAGMLLKGDFADRFISYSDKVVKSMRANFQVFAEMGVIIFGNKRIADQLAMLLAGYYAYLSDGVISEDEAVKLLEAHNWQSVIPSKESNNQARLLMRISQQHINVQVKQKPGERFERSIGELVMHLSGLSDEMEMFTMSDAEDALRRKGIIYDDGFKIVIIANQSESLKTILSNTPWSTNWAQALKAVAGASCTEKLISFGGFKSRGMAIPVTTFLDTSEAS